MSNGFEPQIFRQINARGEKYVHDAAGSHIIGYGQSDRVMAADRTTQRQLDQLFNGEQAPPASVVLAAADRTGTHLYGGAVIETAYPRELATKDRDRARMYARLHRTLAAVFVMPEHRGQGIGAQLIDQAAYSALESGARYLDGFVDDRNESADFYRHVGATVMPKDFDGLPARSPDMVSSTDPWGLQGHWFYVDLWARHMVERGRCSRCEGTFEFHDDDGGYLVCTKCGAGARDQQPSQRHG